MIDNFMKIFELIKKKEEMDLRLDASILVTNEKEERKR
jgi:hypothetical protein